MTDTNTPPVAYRFDAADVPVLRRELADWYGGPQGVMYYRNAIELGRQEVRPPGPPDKVAALLAGAEATRLREGDLWYVDEDLCALLNAAHASMPVFAPRPSDLPSKTGFAVFAEPIFMYPGEEAHDDELADRLAPRQRSAEYDRMLAKLRAEQEAIVAVSWGPVTNPHWTAGGLWMSFYAASAVHFADMFDDPAAARRARGLLPRLIVDNEATMAWRPDGTDPQPYQLPALADSRGTLSWARLVFAAFQLAAQVNLAEREELPTPRPERRRAQRAGLPERDVRIVRLRRSLTAARDAEHDAAGGREWRHRWVVRGHWRNHWYPSLNDHRPLWIAPYLKGPADAPLLGGEKVTVVTADTRATGAG
ncbi:hypothetical protein [Spirilliplanes yamanashiensis]|nr:hypothetical protein [Spirilliplanes yamanashiensis]MDP9818352.1 hypothetical protein [Spirilliplanes yamanashiensis]